MCGAASVLGTLAALAQMQAPVHVVGIIAAVENMPGSRATQTRRCSHISVRPNHRNSQHRRRRPPDSLRRPHLRRALQTQTVVDIATLTGACVVALGHHASGLFANNQALANALLNAGEAAQDRAWQMPLWDDYQKGLRATLPTWPTSAAAKAAPSPPPAFLSRFTKAYHWAHLDIAGTASAPAAPKEPHRPPGRAVG